jgi:hypothetical protein
MKQPNKFNSQLQQEILDSFQQLVKALIKTLLEALMLEEREIYLEETEDYANGFYSRDLLLKELNEWLNSRKLGGLRRLNRGTTMLFLENFFTIKRTLCDDLVIPLKGLYITL